MAPARTEARHGSDSPTIWTIGHWTHPIGEFVKLLHGPGIELVADVRAQPGSRRSPQFDSDDLQRSLRDADIDYLRVPALAGRRRRQDVDPGINAAWQNASFKNYADYTLTTGYRDGIEQLADLARDRRVAVMCGEPVPWRCHRLIIANTLTAQEWTVLHLMPDGSTRQHELGQWGATPVVDGDRVTYPDQPS